MAMIREQTNGETVLAALLELPAQEQARLASALIAQLPSSVQVQLVMQILPDIAPTIQAALRKQTASVIGGGTPQDAVILLQSWLADSASDDDDQAWDEIMHNLSVYS